MYAMPAPQLAEVRAARKEAGAAAVDATKEAGTAAVDAAKDAMKK